jgi:hypothetical protein
VTVNAPDFAYLYQRKLRTLGRHLIVADSEPKNQVLRRYDILTGKDVWKKSFGPNAQVLKSESPDIAGMIEPNGKVTVIDVNTQQEVLQARIDPKNLDKSPTVYLLQDRFQFYLAINNTADNPANRWGGPWPNVTPYSGLRSVLVNGLVYAFLQSNGKMMWYYEVSGQALVLDQFEELPVLLFTSRSMDPNRGYQYTAARSLDKRTGKLLYDSSNNNGQQFHALTVDPRLGKIDFHFFNRKISHTLVSDAGEASTQSTAPAGERHGANPSALDKERQLRETRELVEKALQSAAELERTRQQVLAEEELRRKLKEAEKQLPKK